MVYFWPNSQTWLEVSLNSLICLKAVERVGFRGTISHLKQVFEVLMRAISGFNWSQMGYNARVTLTS